MLSTRRLLTLLMLVGSPLFATSTWHRSCVAQESDDAAREKLIVDRFIDVLMKRPRPGTALDRVYGFHIQAGTLDQLIAGLTKQASEGDGNAGNRWMLVGLLQLQRGNDAAAAESLAKADAILAEDPMASYYLGKSLLLIGKGDAAAEALTRSIERGPDRNEALPVYTELGRLYSRSQQTDKALAVWHQLEERFPGDVRVGEQIARTLADEGQDTAALERYEKLAKQSAAGDETRIIGFQIAAAELKRRMGRGDDALQDFESLLAKLRPSSWLHADVRRRIEAGFLRSGDYAALADYYAAQVKQQPDEIELRLRHGQALAKAGRLNEAETALIETTNLAPENADARLALIELLRAGGKMNDAAKQLETLVKQSPDNPDYLVRLGNAWLDDSSLEVNARHDAAAAAWMQLADLRKVDAVVAAQVGDLMRRIERNDQAIAQYRRASELAPDQPQYREYLGEFLYRLDRKDEAIDVWSQIAAGDRGTRDNLVRLAEVFNTFEQPEKSLAAFSKAAELDPTFGQRLRFAELLSRSNRFEDAIAQLDAAEPIAQSPDEREQWLRARIGVYSSSGKLNERIATITAKAEASKSISDFRELALLLQAAARVGDATKAIEQAMDLDAGDTANLSVAAELYQKAQRYGEAIAVYQSLAKIDSRFLPNYLKQIATLQMQLGQVDAALVTADQLIAAQPGNPESYRFYAEQCFRVGRDDDGIERLRRALRAAPRDRDSRRALASVLADHFRTDEAIELNWQLLEDSTEFADQTNVVTSLAALYERKGDFDRLIERLETRGREASDIRTSALLASAAHRATNDFGSARQSLESLLSDNPRDAELLEQMVKLAEAASDPEAALGYQQQLIALADTPENRAKLLGLLVDSGQLDQAEATLERLRGIDEPATMVNMIDRTIMRGETDAAVRFCRAVLDRQPDLWEVRIRLAALLLQLDKFDESTKEIELVEALKLPATTKSELSKTRPARPNPNQPANPTIPSEAVARLNSAYTVSRLPLFFKLGRYARAYISPGSTSPLAITDYGQAVVLGTGLRLVAAMKQDRLGDLYAEMVPPGFIDQAQDAESLWTAYTSVAAKSALESSLSQRPSAAKQDDANAILWRLAKFDKDGQKAILGRLLPTRLRARHPQAMTSAKPAAVDPLTPERLEILRAVLAKTTEWKSPQGDVQLLAPVYDELAQIGAEAEVDWILKKYQQPPTNFDEASAAIAFFVMLKRGDDLNATINQLVDNFETLATSTKKGQMQSLTRMLAEAFSMTEVSDQAKLAVCDLMIAAESRSIVTDGSARTTISQTGTTNAYYLQSGQYTSSEIAIPFSSRLMSESFASQFYQATKPPEQSEARTQLMSHLASGSKSLNQLPAQAAAEQNLRNVTAAFFSWWAGNKEGAYSLVTEASDANPDDDDLRIERARLAAELNRPAAALEALDNIHPIDQKTLRVRELAALNLASRLGQLDRAKTAATRLFGMRLDSSTDMLLAEQLNRLGMREMATAVLQRTQRRGGQSVNEMISLAQRYSEAGEREAAAEVAFAALRKLSSGSEMNAEYYRRTVIQVLKQSGRLDSLLSQSQQRVKSAPNSLSAITELAELYTAAGRREDADKVLQQLAALQPNDPKILWATAKQLAQAGKHAEAVDKFLDVIEKNPEYLQREYYTLAQSASSADVMDKVFERLTKIDPNRIEVYAISNFLNYNSQRTKGSDVAKPYIEHLLKNISPDSLGSLLGMLNNETFRISDLECMPGVVIRVFSDDATYAAPGQFWQSGSYGNSGQFSGALDVLLETINRDEKLQTQVHELLSSRLAGDKASPVASVLMLALDANQVEPSELAHRTEKLITDAGTEVSFQLWWQVGQYLEDQKGREKSTVMVFEHVNENSVDANRRYESSVVPKLVNAYAKHGDKDKARDLLLKSFQTLDFSRDNQYNPGYGEYQYIAASRSIANQFIELGDRFAAIRVYSELLSNPQRFEAAKRWGGGGRDQATFETSLTKVFDELSNQDFERFLTLGDQGVPFDLIPLAASATMKPSRSSIAAAAVSALKATPDGREMLTKFDGQCSDRLASKVDLSLLAMRAMIASELDSNTAASLLAKIAADPALASIDDEKKLDSSVVQMLYSPVIVALTSTNEAIKTAAIDVANKLVKLAAEQEKADIGRALSFALIGASGAGDQSELANTTMRDQLNIVAPVTDAIQVASTEIADQCISVAEVAQQAGAWEVSLEAIVRAMGGGPPLKSDAGSQGASGTFLARANRSIGSQSLPDADLQAITKRVVLLVAKILDCADNDEKSRRAAAVYRTLQQVVLPKSRPGEVFLYLSDMFTYDAQRMSRSADPDMNPPSLARAMVDAAIQGNQTQTLVNRLDSEPASAAIAPQIAMLRTLLVFGQRDPAAADESLVGLAVAIGIVDGEVKPDTKEPTKSAGSFSRPGDLFNLVLHATLPIQERDGVTENIAKLQSYCLKTDTPDDNARMLSWVTKKLVASSNVKVFNADAIIENFFESIRKRYGQYNGDYAEQQTAYESIEMIGPTLEAKRWTTAGKLLRNYANASSDIQSQQSFAVVALMIGEVDADTQYRLLRTMMFGESKDAPLGSAAGAVSYVEPPAVLRSTTLKLDLAKQVPLAHTDFSMTGSALMIAQVAAKCGKTAELIEQLGSHVEKPGDDVEAMIGQAHLAAGNIAAAEEILARVIKHLQDTAPTAKDTQPLANTSAIFLASCANDESLRTQAATAWTAMLSHARHRNSGSGGLTRYSRMATAQGQTIASGAKHDSPSPHFISVPVADYSFANDVQTGAQFVVGDGSLRMTGGSLNNVLMLKYPLAGDFVISHRNIHHPWGVSRSMVGGVFYYPNLEKQQALMFALGQRTNVQWPNPALNKDKGNLNAIEISGEEVTMKVNDTVVATHKRTESFPFVGIGFSGNHIVEVDDLRIVGNVTIPREVKLIESEMRGWACPTRYGTLPKVLLPVDPKATATPQQPFDEESPTTKTTWHVVDDELQSAAKSGEQFGLQQRHVQYQRPLLDGETIDYEFFREEGKLETHLTIGRVLVLLRKDGIRLRWLEQGQSLETATMDSKADVAPDADDIVGDLVLRDNDWNHVKLTGQADRVLIEINGVPTLRCPVALETQFGLYAEADRECRVRNVTLAGPWPESLPSDLIPSN